MDGFVNKASNGNKTVSITRKTGKTNFLTEATALKADSERDVGLDKLGEMKNNLCNVVQYFDLVKELENVKAEIQQLQFPDNFPVEEYRLIEVDKKLAEEFESGQRLVFRGEVEDYVVMCSEDRSYAVKEVETSNSLLLCPHLNLSQNIESDSHNTLEIRMINGLCHHYMELKSIECVSSYRLREKLHESMLTSSWKTEDESVQAKTYSLSQLLDTIQMSEGEMVALIKKMPVVEHQGKLRWLSYDLRDDLVTKIIEFCDDDLYPDVNVERVTLQGIRNALSENLTDNMIKWFLEHCCEKEDDDGFKMMESALARSLSSYLLRHVSKLELTAFERQIDQLLPVGMKFNKSYLGGIALIEESFKGSYISYLNVEDLPEEPRARLKLLFEHKTTWLMDEVAPYLSDICATTKALNSLMVSHCRSTKNENGDKVFCALKPV